MFVEQVKIVVRKNFLLAFRSNEIFIEALFPFVVGMIMGLVSNELTKVIFGIPFISFTRSVVYNLLYDKAERFKELQKIMGLTTSAYNFGWLMTYYLRGLLATIFFVIPALYYDVLQGSGFDSVLAIIMYISNMFMSIHFAFFASTFFSRPRLGAEVYMLFSLAMTMVYYVFYSQTIATNNSRIMLIAFLCPQSAMITSWLSNSWQGSTQIIYFSSADAFLVIFSTSAFYLIAYLYFDQIVQSEFGSGKHPLFFVKDLFSSDEERQRRKTHLLISEDISKAIHKEEVDLNKFQSSVKIQNLSKQFGKFKAVDDLSLTLFEKQIFCLLGHNGAGKTTTISMLTGLLKKSSGRIQFYDKDQDLDYEDVRQYIGLCTQRDALYEKMTIEEHLQLIGEIKGKFGEELQRDIESVIMKCALDLQRGKVSGVLSGGNKRKLSLAMALIGGSKVIFLDEPSSGLDSMSRIQIREIISQMRNSDRTIVLTTHHLEEVEELADRTAILAKGKLLAVGTNNFIKKKFGIGYHLTLSKKTQSVSGQQQQLQQEQQQQSTELNLSPNLTKDSEGYKQYELMKFLTPEKCENLKQIVIQQVSNAKYNPQSAKGTVAFTLPFDAKHLFSNLFKIIEESYSDVQINFEMNTLEDAFINIGMDESKYLASKNSAEEQEKFTDFNEIQAPACLENPPKFVFWNQMWALFLRRFIVSMRSVSMIFTFIFPLLCQIGGIVLTKQAFKDMVINDNSDLATKNFGEMSLSSAFQLLSYCLTMTGIAASPVNDNENKLRYALTVMGCRNTTYWIGAFAFDCMIMFFMLLVFLLIVPYMDVQSISDNIGTIFLIICISIPCFIGFVYLFSFVYKKNRTVYLTCPWVMFFFFFAGFQALFLYEKTTSPGLRWLYCILSPFLCTSNAMLVLALETYVSSPNQYNEPVWVKMFPDSFAYHTTYMYILVGQAIVFISLAIFVDYSIQQIPNKSIRKEDYSDLEREQVVANSEVSEEDTRVASPFCNDKIKVSKLYKTYYPKGKAFTAIQNNSFGVNNGEVMGLLGPNGAGKSTTFNIITSLISKSSGSVKLKNQEIRSGAMDIYQDVGICPQFDSLYENLSVNDHLKLFGRMKGLSGKDLKDSVEYFIKIMQLQDYKHKAAGKLSGGNKRKLCVTIALIGGPDMQFFDEPSSGVDPIARRFLWNTLKMSLQKRNGAIVLTTHSMHEAETLCTKIGILVNGKFQCIGSPDFLKKKYGDGYRLKVHLKGDLNAAYLHDQITKKIPNAKRIINFDGSMVVYQLQYENFSFYEVYSLMDNLSNIPAKVQPVSGGIEIDIQHERNSINEETQKSLNVDEERVSYGRKTIARKGKFIIDTFEITESTLEQIFVQFSQHQAVKDEATENKVKRRKFWIFG